jgi:hypothetical protein
MYIRARLPRRRATMARRVVLPSSSRNTSPRSGPAEGWVYTSCSGGKHLASAIPSSAPSWLTATRQKCPETKAGEWLYLCVAQATATEVC